MLVAKVSLDYLARNGEMPTSKALALIGNVHSATARRWLVDLRAIVPKQASALRARKG
jgi:hypothetical protein